MPLRISGARCPRGAYLYIRVHPQPQRQTLTGVEFDKGLKDFGIHTLARFVGAHVLPSENATDADNPAGEFLRAVRFGGSVSMSTRPMWPVSRSASPPLSLRGCDEQVAPWVSSEAGW